MAFEPPADAGHDRRRQPRLLGEDLRFDFLPDDALKVAHHGRIRMRAEHAAQQIVCGAHIRHPVAHGFVDGVLERPRARTHAAHLGAQQAHAVDIQLLPAHVFLAHVDHAFHPEKGAHGGGGHAVLPGAGFRDNPALAHAPRQQPLAEAVVDLVRSGMQQIFAFEINPCSA